MNSNFNLAETFNIGAYLYERKLSILPGSFSEFVNGNTAVTTVHCTSFDRPTDERLKLVFWTFKELNSVGGYDVWLSSMSEGKFSGKTVGYFSEPTYSTRINFKT